MAKMSSQVFGKMLLVVVCAIAIDPAHAILADSSTIKILLSRAQAQAQSGHLDIAASTWKQVLASDPSNTEALRSLAAAEVQLGHQAEADAYIQRLRKLGASAAIIGQLQSLRTGPSSADLLRRAATLSKSGQYIGAMELYRKLYGNNPPAGDIALVYYDTESALPADRARAVEGLRKLAKQFPADERYSITLGRVLTYDASSRQEGMTILRRYPGNLGADDALKQGMLWDERPQGVQDVSNVPSQSATPRTPTASELAAGFRALNSGNLSPAAQHFRAALAHEVTHGQANAGLGFVSMRQQNFNEAVREFEQAKADGDRDASVTQALATSRFWRAMGGAQSALDAGDMEVAITGYRSALTLKPESQDALTALGGTFLRAGRPRDAIPYLQRAIRADARSQAAWRALFLAQSQSTERADAVKTAELIPTDLRTKLEADPEFLGSLAADYAAIGRQSQADRILKQALALLRADNDSDSSTAKLLQYASLLLVAKRYNTAVYSYRRVLATDPDNPDAWRGLVTLDHLAGRDAEALREFRQMPVSVSASAQTDTSFLSLLAGIYQSQSQLEAARATLRRAIEISPSTSLRLQLASLELSEGDKAYAAELYEQIADEHPESKEAWIGWVRGLHATGQDREALRQIAEMPGDVRDTLREDPEYLQTVASVYSSTGSRDRAADAIEQVNEIYARQGINPPAAVQLQQGWLLLQAGQNERLARVIQELSNDDLTEDQQTQLTRLWTSWSLQRATQLNRQGKPAAAVAVLSAALRAFSSDVSINNALADAYLANGDPKRAMALYARQDISQSDPSVCVAAIRAALAANNRKQAQSWLQASLDRFGRDSKLLELAAEFEQQRGDSRRAAAYYRAALDAAGPPSIRELTSSRSSSTDERTEASATQELLRLLSSSGETSGQNQRSQTTDNIDGNYQEPLWPAHSESNHSTDAIARSSNTERDYDLSLPPMRTTTSRGHSLNDALATSTKTDNTSEQGLDLVPLNKSIAKDAEPNTQHAMSRGTKHPHVEADSEYGSLAMGDAGISHSKPSRSLAGRAARQEPQYFASPNPPAIAEGATSDESAQHVTQQSVLRRMATPSSLQEIQPIDPPASIAMLAPLPRQQLEVLPPLIGTPSTVKLPLTPRQQMQEHLDAIETGSSPYLGGSSSVGFHNGQPGFDRLTIFSADIEQSAMVGMGARATLFVHPTLLQGGIAGADATFQLGTLPMGTPSDAQTAAGVGGELQLRARSFGAALGYTPHGFLVENVTGRLLIQPDAGPVILSFERQPIEDSQLSYAGLRDPGSVSPTYSGNVWGGVISNAASLQFNRGDAASGWYMQLGGQYITGRHVETNRRIDGYAGAYWSMWDKPTYGKLTLGVNFFGMHFANNQRLFTYGNGGYFSPGAYLLSNLPVTFNGHYGSRFHYRLAGSLGIQAFQEDASPFFPLDSSLQIAAKNQYSIERTNVGANYNAEGDGSYLVTEHWHVGGFFSLDNSRGYNNDRLGFYLRYASHPQPLDSPIGPTGLRSRGLRPLLNP